MGLDIGETVVSAGAPVVHEPSESPPRLPQQIGRYAVLGLLGRGGMGVVYKGYDAALDRRVAIKMFHRARGSAGDTQVREIQARATREAQALAKLSHANIVAVHEVGSYEGQVFIVMEYVHGETLRVWLRSHPPLARVLEVFVQLGQALAAAHRAGIIHRDLKPENVVVREDGLPRLLDFGLARAAEALELEADKSAARGLEGVGNDDITFTSPGDLIGTPAYMAPEQLLRLRACDRSDQYAFCVCLYEAMYGVRPFVADTVEALRVLVLAQRMSLVERPPYSPPSYLRAAILRGLGFAQEDRFPSMDELLAVLIDGKRRRRQRGLLLGGLGLTAIVGSFTGALWLTEARTRAACEAGSVRAAALWLDPTQQQVRERMQATGVSFAAASFERLVPELDRFVREWSAASEQVCLRRDLASGWDDATTTRARECLEESEWALAGLVSVLREATPEVVGRAANAAGGLPKPHLCLRPELLRQRTPRAGLASERARSAVLLAKLARARSLSATGQYGPAAALAQQLLDQLRPEAERRLAAEVLLVQGLALYPQAELAGAEVALHAAASAAASVNDIGLVVDSLGALAHVTGYLAARQDEGLRWGELALAHAESLGHEGQLRKAHALSSLASVHLVRGEMGVAEQQIRDAAILAEAELGPDHPEVVDGLSNLALVLIHQGQAREALELTMRVLVSRRHTRGPNHPSTLTALENAAGMQSELGDFAASAASYRAALELREQAREGDTLGLARVLNSYGFVQSQLGELATAEALLRRSLVIFEQKVGPDDLQLAQPLGNLGLTLTLAGKLDAALAVFERAHALREQTLGPDHVDVAAGLFELAAAETAMDHDERARDHLERALKIVESRESDASLVAKIRFALGRLLWAERPNPRALDLVRAAQTGLPKDPAIREWLAEHGRAPASLPLAP